MSLNIREYSDYREFLRAYIQAKQQESSSWSYGMWARQLKLKSTSTLSMIVNGHRHPGPKVIEAFIDHFSFDPEETSYFLSLIHVQKKIDDPKLQVLLLEGFIREQESNDNITETGTKNLLLQRQTYLLRELTQLEDFKEDADWISKRLREPAMMQNLNNKIEQLVEAKILERKDHSPRPATLNHSGQPPERKDVVAFHREVMNAAGDAITLCRDDERAFYTSFLTVKRNRIHEARQLIRDFQKKFSELMEESPGEEVYQFSMQFFPTTRTPDTHD